MPYTPKKFNEYDYNGVAEAKTKLNSLLKQTPNAYESPYQKQLDSALSKLQQREPFTYDVNNDALYKQYADIYRRNGERAMEDTIAKATTYTGGYGNSYANSVGQQTYQNYMDALNDKVPELYKLARSAYDADTAAMQDEYNLYSGLDQREYGRYRDGVSDYYDRLGTAQKNYDTAYSNAWKQYQMDEDARLDAYNAEAAASAKASEQYASSILAQLKLNGYDVSGYKASDIQSLLESGYTPEMIASAIGGTTVNTEPSFGDIQAAKTAYEKGKATPEQLNMLKDNGYIDGNGNAMYGDEWFGGVYENAQKMIADGDITGAYDYISSNYEKMTESQKRDIADILHDRLSGDIKNATNLLNGDIDTAATYLRYDTNLTEAQRKPLKEKVFDTVDKSVRDALTNGQHYAAIGFLTTYEDILTDEQVDKLVTLIENYGFNFETGKQVSLADKAYRENAKPNYKR